ncbi:hypothetical protein ACRRTK_010251 [Alexandromys fortis]
MPNVTVSFPVISDLKARHGNNGKHQVSWHSCQSAPYLALASQTCPELAVSQ